VAAHVRERRTGLLCMPSLSDLGAGTDCGDAARAPPKNGDRSNGANAMRSVLAFGFLIALCASANAARVHHSKSRHVIVRPSQAVIPSHGTPGGVRIYRDDSVPGGLRTDHDDPPAYDDPSKFGGG
jgi:hypothetical protein